MALMAPPRRRTARTASSSRGTTGEAVDAHRRRAARPDRAGRAPSARPGKTIIAGTGTNDTRQAVYLTERATALGVDAMLSVTPYYNRPSRARAHAPLRSGRGARPTSRSCSTTSPSRTGTNMPPELLAELAQIEGIEGVKQANAAELQLIDGLDAVRRRRRARSRARSTSAARAGSRRQPHRRQRDAPHGRRARAARRDRRVAAGRLRDAVPDRRARPARRRR